MGLLAKANPTATLASVFRHAIIGGVFSTGVCLAYFVWDQPSFVIWPLLLPIAALFGAALAALLEWQDGDGVEIYWVVREVEDEFAIKIGNWQDIKTVDDLYQLALASLRNRGTNANDQEVWHRLKSLLVRQLGLTPEQVVPSARFYVDLPI
jgi:hypothetical protein